MGEKAVAYALDEIRVEAKRIETVRLPLEAFNILTQYRRTYVLTEDLIPSILEKGQLTPGMVAALRHDEALIYVDEINMIYGACHTVDDLVSVILDGVTYYLIVFAGHRRYLTVDAANQGIRAGLYLPSEHYHPFYLAQLHFEITAMEAIELQFHENRYTAPPIHEDAEGMWRLYRHKKSKSPELTPGQFAKTMGRTTDWVRNAFRFCSLPESVQSYVLGDNAAKLRMPYSALVDLARLVEGYAEIRGEHLSEEIMHRWVHKAFINQLNAAGFGRMVNEYLESLRQQKEGGQQSLFGDEQTDAEHIAQVRRVVERGMVQGLWRFAQYVRQVERIREAGLLGKREVDYLGPFTTPEQMERYSEGSPIRLISESCALIELLGPHLAELARKARTGHYRRLTRSEPRMKALAAATSHFAEYEVLAARLPRA